MRYNLQFDKLCGMLGLGELIETPVPLTGGHLHRMFAVKTDRGRYAVKALNPEVMKRPPALPAIIESERVAAIAARHIAAAPARVFEGSAVQLVDGQYYLVYDWIDGVTLTYSEITAEHSAAMGRTLAVLHSVDFGSLCPTGEQHFEQPAVDWEAYLRLGIEAGAEWTGLLADNIGRLNARSARLEASARLLYGDTVVTHRDLEPKNVMWRGDTPVVIDWEAAGRSNPAHDLAETAVYWSRDDAGQITKEKFRAFVGGYKKVRGPVRAAWARVLDLGFSSLSGWLEFSLKRSLGLESCEQDEQQMGTEHVFKTVEAANVYFETVPRLLRWLEEHK